MNYPNFQKILSLIQTIQKARKELKQMGIIRTNKDIVGDYGEWIAAQEYGLKLVDSSVQKTYDAIDNLGLTYQIKTRRVKNLNDNTSFDFHNYEKFNYLVVVFLDEETLKPIVKPLKISYKTVQKYWLNNKTSKRFRWNKKIRKMLIPR